ncbi:hypothetical protein [Alteromonas sp. S015]|uniref:hypothetical protein n=1 Tax=Alteromonas sp. S015 TaxID=3117401 RepID=UPI002FE0F1E3
MTFEDLCKNLTNNKITKISFHDSEFRRFCFWPPNVFALLGALLKNTGTYTYVACLPGNFSLRDDHEENALHLGEVWFNFFSEGSRWLDYMQRGKPWSRRQFAPKVLEKLVRSVFSKQNLKREITDIGRHWYCEESQVGSLTDVQKKEDENNWHFLTEVFTLFAICDYACMGIETYNDGVFAAVNYMHLQEDSKNFSYSDILRHKAVVLAKQRTPQVGIGLNSLSHYLAFIESEVNIGLYQSYNNQKQIQNISDIKMLLLPWPLTIDRSNFSPSILSENKSSSCVGGFAFFDYQNRLGVTIHELIKVLNDAGEIDILVFPEATLEKNEYLRLLEELILAEKQGTVATPNFVICGIYSSEPNNWAENQVCLSTKSTFIDGQVEWEHIWQSKHHRWCLDPSQVRAYGIQAALSSDFRWWEGIKVGKRELKVINIDNLFSITPLICEDLARQDPVSEVLRALGPNLVVALLLDGPQLQSRWSSRYASILADDPGCSVLSLTAMGMIERSNKTSGYTSRTIALWKDSENGYIEIDLPADTKGIIMSVECKYNEEFTLDGRSDGCSAVNLIYKEHFAVISDN